jgi:hypothetical protein
LLATWWGRGSGFALFGFKRVFLSDPGWGWYSEAAVSHFLWFVNSLGNWTPVTSPNVIGLDEVVQKPVISSQIFVHEPFDKITCSPVHERFMNQFKKMSFFF